MISMEERKAWIAALQRAALPDSEKIIFSRSHPAPNEVSFRLTCLNKAGQKIGDNRDYDLLKAVLMPLERLSEKETGEFEVMLNLGDMAFSQAHKN